MAEDRLRVGLDANVLIAGVRLPPLAVRGHARRNTRSIPPRPAEQVISEARRHFNHPDQLAAFESFLSGSAYEALAMPPRGQVEQNLDLVRSAKDVPIALALLEGGADIFVTNDRDFTDPEATAERFRRQVRVMLTAVFLRDVLGWSPQALKAIRNRTWEDILTDADFEPTDA